MLMLLILRLAHPDGSLADLTMVSTSPEPLLKEAQEKDSVSEMLAVDCVDEDKKKESLSIHSAHLSSQEDLHQSSAATDPEAPSDQSSGDFFYCSIVLFFILKEVCKIALGVT